MMDEDVDLEWKLRRIFQRRKIWLLATLAFLLVGIVFALLVGNLVMSLLSLVAAVVNLLAGAVQMLQAFNDGSNRVAEEEMERFDDFNYRRLVGILDRAGVSFAEMLEKYAGGKEVVLVSVDEGGDGSATESTLIAGPTPGGPAERDVEASDSQSGDRSQQHEDPETAYVHVNELGMPDDGTRGSEKGDGVLVPGLETYQVSEDLWLIPPREVPDCVAEGEKSAVDEFAEDPDDVAFAVVVDLWRVFPRDDNRIRTLLENAGVIDKKTIRRAVWDNRVNLLEHVRKGNLAFFLPQSIEEEAELKILRNQDVVLRDVKPRAVRGLADETNREELVDGFKRIDVEIGNLEDAVDKIIERAKMWQDRLEELTHGPDAPES